MRSGKRASERVSPSKGTSHCFQARTDLCISYFWCRTPVQIYDCNGSGAQQWVWNQADTKIKLAGTSESFFNDAFHFSVEVPWGRRKLTSFSSVQDFCLDTGASPGNGVLMKIWTCYDNLPAQAFYRQLRRVFLPSSRCSSPSRSLPFADTLRLYFASPFEGTADNRFAVTGKGQCLDLTNGRADNSNR